VDRINSRDDYRRFLAADRAALGAGGLADWVLNDIWRFERALRRVEYLSNCGGLLPVRLAARLRLRRLGRRLGFSIPPNVFGPGLSIAHYGTVVVNGGARVGANCRLHVDVVIGTAAGQSDAAPTIGDGAYIGPGAKIFGPITLGDNVRVGANAVVNRSHEESTLTLVGAPARPVMRQHSA
jgi:serine O-acetyltransferase